ncbi:MAG: glycerophosphodiester phosphodiesterase [Actinomycetales bacterium]|nr:MAG: glycerophosphodiester phosphodiesterase [Actinomycetales bacterium]
MTVLVSAHRGGAGNNRPGENTVAAVERAVRLGADYIEFDVHRSPAGRLVVGHDAPTDESGVLLSDVVAALGDRAGAHVDLKLATGEHEAVAVVVAALPLDRIVVTTSEDSSIPRLRAWSVEHAPGLMLGLSTAARSHRGTRPSRWLAKTAAWFPRARMRRAGVDVVVSHQLIARYWLRSWARRRGLPLLVWTVDGTDALRYWTSDPHTWMVTTNHPDVALALRPH